MKAWTAPWCGGSAGMAMTLCGLRRPSPELWMMTFCFVARVEGCLLVTADKDFGELVFREGLPHRGVLLVRLLEHQVEGNVEMASNAIATHGEKLEGKFSVLDRQSLRIRWGPNVD